MRITTLILLGLAPLVSEAKLYKWVDSNGSVHYSDTMPESQSANKGTSELNQRGIVVKQAESPAQREAREREEKIARDQETQRLEQARKDKALLQTFTTTREIDDMRDRNLGQIDAALTTNKARRKSAEKRLGELKQQLARFVKGNKKRLITETEADIRSVEQEIVTIDRDSALRIQERAHLISKAESDKKRLIELKGQ